MGVDPLTSRRASWWGYRRRGFSLAEIGRMFGVTRQAVYDALRLADRDMVKAFRELCSTYKITDPVIDAERGMLIGYSRALESRVLLVYSPGRGINTWYRYRGQCEGCERYDQCMSLVGEEAERLGVEISGEEENLPPAKLAEIVFHRAWPEVFHEHF